MNSDLSYPRSKVELQQKALILPPLPPPFAPVGWLALVTVTSMFDTTWDTRGNLVTSSWSLNFDLMVTAMFPKLFSEKRYFIGVYKATQNPV